MYEERANLRAAIDASPLWDVDVATRKALFQPMLMAGKSLPGTTRLRPLR